MRVRRVGLGVVLALSAGGAAPVGSGGAATMDSLVAAGARWWRESPDPRSPVACATCHHDPAATREWAASFPKLKPEPPPYARVMTFLQANAEAVRRHYGVAEPRPVATAITAYLAAHGAGRPPTPGIAAGQPVFPARLAELARSVARGQGLYARRCAACHDESSSGEAVTRFPRVQDGRGESLEAFLEHHTTALPPLAWDGQPMADVIAYLLARRAGGPAKEQP